MIVENGGFSGYAVTTLPVPARCQLHYGLERDELDSFIAPEDRRLCARGFLDTEAVAMIRQAEVVFFASKWQMWSAARFAASLPRRTGGPCCAFPQTGSDRRVSRFPRRSGQFVDLLENIGAQMLELPILDGFARDERGCAWPGI